VSTFLLFSAVFGFIVIVYVWVCYYAYRLVCSCRWGVDFAVYLSLTGFIFVFRISILL